MNKITIVLQKSRKQISFDLINDKNIYMLSYYGNTWYLTICK